MTRRACLPALLPVLLGGCASAPPEPPAVPQAALEAAFQPNVPHKAQAAALPPPAGKIAFDSGYEVWMYRYATPAGAGEYVVLFGPDGAVRKTRMRPPPTPAR